MDFIHFYGVTIEPCLKFYTVPSPSQYMVLRSRSRTLKFLCLIFTVSVSAKPLIDLNVFGMSRCKILKFFIKEKCNCRRAFLSGDRSYSISHSNVIHSEVCDKYCQELLQFGVVNLLLFYVRENQIPPTLFFP